MTQFLFGHERFVTVLFYSDI